MITINLLPQGEREAAPASTMRMLSITASVAIFVIAFIFYGITHYFDLPNAQTLLQSSQVDLAKLKKKNITPAYNEVNKLTAVLKQREDSIENIRILKSEMTRKLTEWSNIFRERHVWAEFLKIQKVEVKKARTTPGRGQAPPPAPKIESPEYEWEYLTTSAGAEMQTAFNYYRALQEDTRFWKDFIKVQTPEYKQQKFGEEWNPSIGYEFAIKMTMKINRDEAQK